MRYMVCTWLAAGGCGVTDFELSQTLPEQEVSGAAIPAPIAGTFPLPLSLALGPKVRKQTSQPIASLTLAGLTLQITETQQSGGDLDSWAFLDEIHVFARSTLADSALPRIELASKLAPGGVQTYRFDVDHGVDLLPYVTEGSVVEAEATGTAPPDAVSFAGHAEFTVEPR
ncbi:MAG: hypothetical protein WKG01_31815 [Kofleriaceae bacterium]